MVRFTFTGLLNNEHDENIKNVLVTIRINTAYMVNFFITAS